MSRRVTEGGNHVWGLPSALAPRCSIVFCIALSATLQCSLASRIVDTISLATPRLLAGQPECNSTFHQFPELNAILANLTLSLNQSIPIKQSGFEINVTDLECHKVQMNCLEVEDVCATGVCTTLVVSASQVQFACNAKISEQSSGNVVPEGDVDVALSIVDLGLLLPFELQLSKENLVEQISLDNSDPRKKVFFTVLPENLTFSGGTAKLRNLLNLLKGTIILLLEEEIPKMVLSEVSSLLTSQLNPILQYVQVMEPYTQRRPAPASPVQPPPDATWVNWQRTTSLNVLSTLVAELRVNLILELTGKASLSVPLRKPIKFPLHSALANITLSVQQVDLTGLDTITSIDIVNATGNYTMRSRAAFQKLGVQAVGHLEATAGPMVQGALQPLEENFTMSLELINATVDLDLLLAVDQDKFGALEMSQLLMADTLFDALGCLLSVFAQSESQVLVQLTQVQVHAAAIEGPTSTGLGPDVDRLLQSILAIPHEWYGPLTVVNTLLDLYGLSAINTELQNYLQLGALLPCNPPPPVLTTQYIDWTTSPLQNLSTMVSADIVNVLVALFKPVNNGGVVLNKALDPHGSVTQEGVALDYSFANMSLFGMDTLSDLQLLEPVGQYNLNTAIHYQDSQPITAAAELEVSVMWQGKTVTNRIDMSTSMAGLYFSSGALLKVNRSKLGQVRMNQLSNLGCVLASVVETEVSGTEAGVSDASLTFHAAGTAAAPSNITQTVNAALGYLASQFEQFVNYNMDGSSVKGEEICNGKTDDSKSKPWEMPFWLLVILVFMLAVLGLVGAFYTFFYDPALGKDMGMFTPFDDEDKASGAGVGAHLGAAEDPMQWSLMANPKLHPYLRLAIPALLVTNFVAFALGNAHTAATIELDYKIGDDWYHGPVVYWMGLKKTSTDSYNAKAYAVCLLISFFSGGFLYLNVCTLLAVWVMPPSFLHPVRRAQVLQVSQFFGKWTLVEPYILIMMMVAYNISFSITPELTFELILYFNRDNPFGSYWYIVACIGSMVLTQIIVLLNNKVSGEYAEKEAALPELEQHLLEEESGRPISAADPSVAAGGKEAISQHHFELGKGCSYRWTLRGKCVLVCFLLGVFTLVLVGCFTESFQFNNLGMVGLLLGDDASSKYSFVSMGLAIPTSSWAEFGRDALGVRFLQFCFFLTSLVLPLLVITQLIVLWLVPLSAKMQYHLLMLCVFANACNSLDVFMTSIIAALLELGLFAKFLLDGRCDELNRILKQYFRYNFSSESDAVCYQVSASLLAGAYILMVCVLLYITITQLCLYIFNTALKERYKALRDGSIVRERERAQEGSLEHAFSSLRKPSRCVGWMQYCGLVEDVPVVLPHTIAGDSEWVAYLPQDP